MWQHLILGDVASNAFSDTLNQMGNPADSATQAIKEASSQVFYGLKVSPEFFQTLGNIVRAISILWLIMIMIGAIQLVISMVGNSGKWRKAGTVISLTAAVMLVATHAFVIIGCSYNQLGNGKFMTFFFTILTQLMLYAASPMLFTLGSNWQMMGEMINWQAMDRKATRCYNSILVLMLLGAVIMLMVEVL